MQMRPIQNPDDHSAALREIERLWGAAPGSEDGDRLDILATLVDAFERDLPGLPELDPVELIEVTMAEEGFGRNDLALVLGSRSRASEILNRKRPLTLPMVHKLSVAWGLPAAALVRPYDLEPHRRDNGRRSA